MQDADRFLMTFSCDENIPKQQVTCGVSVSGEEGVYTSNVVWAKSDVARINATITAGAEKLAAQTGAQATPSSTGSGTSTAGPSATSGLPRSTGAASRFGVEGSALFALVGAAALNAW